MDDQTKEYWSRHYGEDGASKVDARRVLNYCLGDGQETVDFDELTADTLRSAGIGRGATIVDVGCGGKLNFLQLMLQSGHVGELIGIEPNTAQIHGYPFWQPKDSEPASDIKTVKFGPITLIESDANYLPRPDQSVDALTLLFSGYHIAKNKQEAAFNEMKRVLKVSEKAGIMAVALSHDGNKAGIRRQESAIAKWLSEKLKTEVKPPTPINAGLTTEEGLERVQNVFPNGNVWLYEHFAKITINTPGRFSRLLAAHRTTADLYRVVNKNDKTGRALSAEEISSVYKEGLLAVVGDDVQIDRLHSDGRGARWQDDLKQGLIVASERELILPPGYQEVRAA